MGKSPPVVAYSLYQSPFRIVAFFLWVEQKGGIITFSYEYLLHFELEKIFPFLVLTYLDKSELKCKKMLFKLSLKTSINKILKFLSIFVQSFRRAKRIPAQILICWLPP